MSELPEGELVQLLELTRKYTDALAASVKSMIADIKSEAADAGKWRKYKMKIQLSDHFTYGKLFRFCLSPIIMMVFTSIYGVVDGLFVSNFVGKIPFAAINLIMPFIMILGGMGFMVGTGGSALVAKTLGEGDNARANHYFSMMVELTRS